MRAPLLPSCEHSPVLLATGTSGTDLPAHLNCLHLVDYKPRPGDPPFYPLLLSLFQ